MIEVVVTSTPEVITENGDDIVVSREINVDLLEMAAQGPVGPQGATGATGPVGPQGAVGPQGPTGGGNSSYTHVQGTPTDTWNITHNLNRYPSVTVVDSTWATVEGAVTYVDANNVTITFSGGFSGRAYLN